MKNKKARILMLQLCVDEQLTDRGRARNRARTGLPALIILTNFWLILTRGIYEIYHLLRLDIFWYNEDLFQEFFLSIISVADLPLNDYIEQLLIKFDKEVHKIYHIYNLIYISFCRWGQWVQVKGRPALYSQTNIGLIFLSEFMTFIVIWDSSTYVCWTSKGRCLNVECLHHR